MSSNAPMRSGLHIRVIYRVGAGIDRSLTQKKSIASLVAALARLVPVKALLPRLVLANLSAATTFVLQRVFAENRFYGRFESP
jgi:hypothetical protein